MLSPEAERVLRYLVEVEELAEAVLSDKRQVRDAAASFVRQRAGFRSERLLCAGLSLPFILPLRVPWILTPCLRLLRHRFPNVNQTAETRAAFVWTVG